jgi:hypothetical protein
MMIDTGITASTIANTIAQKITGHGNLSSPALDANAA